jgi:diaminopimelate decarboxylase
VDPWERTSAADFEDLAAAHGTPFFLYDADEICSRVEAVREAFQGLVGVYYAVKANPNLALLGAVRRAVDGLDISSGGEMEQARLAGFEPASVSFAGPAKTASELADAIRDGTGFISIESTRELNLCLELAGRLGVRARIGVRINPLRLNRSFGIKMGGKASQFGIDEERAGELFDVILAAGDRVDFQGIHVYAGSQCFDVSGAAEGVADTLRIVREIESTRPVRCRTVNLGGGFGVSHAESHRELDLESLASAVVPLLREFVESSTFERKVVFELGRYLTADAGIYVCRVVGSKESRGKTFFVTDGGLHHHLAAAGTFGATLRSNFVLRNLTRPFAPKVRCDVAGPSCNPTDLLGVDMELPRPEDGDLIGVLKSGSYGLTASPVLFLGRQTPAELVRRNGVVVLGRPPRRMTDFN